MFEEWEWPFFQFHSITWLFSDLEQGYGAMGVRPSFPMGGVQVILGNDLAGNQVWPVVPMPVNTPNFLVEGFESPKLFLLYFPPVQWHVLGAGPVVVPVLTFQLRNKTILPVPAFPLPLSCSDLVKEQRDDPTLQALYSQVFPVDEVESAACGVFFPRRPVGEKVGSPGGLFCGGWNIASCSALFIKNNCTLDCT